MNQKLNEAVQELFLVRREVELAEAPISLEAIFYTHSKARMMGAKFYHECMIQKIPCVLEVGTQYGIMDAVIEIDQRFIIIELKTFSYEVCQKGTKEQIKRYSKHNCPVVLVGNQKSFHEFLVKLKQENLANRIYIYQNGRINLSKLSTKAVDNSNQAFNYAPRERMNASKL